jgi:unsaturated rhamnogalacturonyl hydrolase
VKNSLFSPRSLSEGLPASSGWTPMVLRGVTLGAVLAAGCVGAVTQTAPAPGVTAQSAASVERAHVGDAPDDPGPLATGLSAELKPKDI